MSGTKMENSQSNPWDIQSLYDLQFFNCPCCSFKIKSRQEFVNHAYDNHAGSSEYLTRIKDSSLKDLKCPWNDLKEEPIDPFEDIDDTIYEESKENTQNQNHYDTIKDALTYCEPCNIYFSSEEDLKKHKKKENHFDPELRCQPCNVYFSSLAALKKHQSDVHLLITDDIPEYIQNDKVDECSTSNDQSDYMKHCELCNLYFSSSKNLQKHIDSNHEKPQKTKKTIDSSRYCKACDSHFKTEAGLKQHIGIKHFDPELKCSICDACHWIDKDGLERHHNKMHTTKKCPLCDTVCDNHPDFKNHLRFEHFDGGKIRHGPMNSLKDKEAKKQKSPCPSCGKLIVFKYLNQHLKVGCSSVDGQFSCEKCSKTFKRKEHLKDHLKTVHEKVRDYQCDQCGMKFTHEHSMRQHVKTVHQKIKEHKCDSCDKTFALKNALILHKKRHHDFGEMVNCEHCNKKFPTTYILKNHIKSIHEGIRPFECKECGKSFYRLSNYKDHFKTVHQGIKEFKCSHCDKEFARRNILQKHIESYHKEMNYV